jgi:hypothetical protein
MIHGRLFAMRSFNWQNLKEGQKNFHLAKIAISPNGIFIEKITVLLFLILFFGFEMMTRTENMKNSDIGF